MEYSCELYNIVGENPPEERAFVHDVNGVTEVDVAWIMKHHEWYTYLDVRKVDGVLIHEFYFEIDKDAPA